MKKYLENATLRRKTQICLCVVQAVLAVLAITFMTLFVTTAAPSEKDFSLCAIIFPIVWGVVYLAQLVFAGVTHRKISDKNKFDKMFLLFSIVFVAVVVAIYGIIVLCL